MGYKSVFFGFFGLLLSQMTSAQQSISRIEWEKRIQELAQYGVQADSLLFFTIQKMERKGHESHWWTFPPAVGARFGLQINDSVDERRHPYLAYQAFLHYYKAAQQDRKPLKFKREGIEEFHLPEKKDSLAAQWVPLFPQKKIELKLVAQKMGYDKMDFRSKNQHILTDFLPESSAIFIKVQDTALFWQHKDDFYQITIRKEEEKPEKPSLPKRIIIVKSGESLSVIAEREGVSLADIRQWNQLFRDLIYAGQKLVVYGDAQEKKPKSPATSEPERFEMYTVQEGDTLWSIALRYAHVSIEDIQKINNVGDVIRVGQQLKIPIRPAQ